MGKTELHRRKRSKNLAVLAIILAWCLLLFLITMVRIAHGQELPSHDGAAPIQNVESRPYDLENFFSSGRARHHADMDQSQERLDDRRQTHQIRMEEESAGNTERGRHHQGKVDTSMEKFTENAAAHQEKMDTDKQAYNDRGAAHQEELAGRPDTWWRNWQDRLFPADYGEPSNQ